MLFPWNKTEFYSHWLQGFIFIFYVFKLFLVCWKISVLSEANLQRPPHSPVIIIEGHQWSVSHWEMKLWMFSSNKEKQSCTYYAYRWKPLHWTVFRNRQYCITGIHHLTKTDFYSMLVLIHISTLNIFWFTWPPHVPTLLGFPC